MKKSVFEFLDYKAYLLHWIASRPNEGRGERSRLAESLKCQVAYVSQVLNGGAHLSLEQAELLNPHLGHGSEESDFFLHLVLLARAGTPSLKAHFERQIRQTIESRSVLKNRLEIKKTLTREDQAVYYSAWYYAAVHVLVSVPGFRSPKAIGEYLGLPSKKVRAVLEFLSSTGLIEEIKGGEYRVGTTNLYLGNDSPMIGKHHVNWRMQALAAVDREQPGELHYSSVISLSRKDAEKVRSILVSAIEQVRPVVRDSKDEILCCYLLDFFEVGKASER